MYCRHDEASLQSSAVLTAAVLISNVLYDDCGKNQQVSMIMHLKNALHDAEYGITY